MKKYIKLSALFFFSITSLLWGKQSLAAGTYSDEGIAFYAQNTAPSYAYENIAFYAYDPTAIQPDVTLPVYRFYNPSTGDHFYTISESEKNKLVDNPSVGYSLESTAFFADSVKNDASEIPVYRFYNTLNGDHFYTTSEKEKTSVLNNPQWGYRYEQIAFYVFPSQGDGTVPVYRFYNASNGDHFYTASENEKNKIAIALVYRFYNSSNGDHFYTISKTENNKLASNPQSGYSPEGMAFYAYLNQANGTAPIYRFYNSSTGDHFYTSSEGEKTKLQSGTSYAYEGIAFYAYPNEVAGTLPIYRIYNNSTGDHFYTISLTERNRALTSGLGPDISVGLWGYQKADIQANAFRIDANKKYNIRDNSGKILAQVNGGTITKITYDANGNLRVFGSIADTLVSSSVTFDAADGDNTNIIFDTHRTDQAYTHYRGQIKAQYYHGSDTLDLDGDKNVSEQVQQVWIINTLPLEQYVWGMGETKGTGPDEHTKVMTMVFRSYGFWYVKYANKYAPYGFKITDDINQVYKGYDWETKYKHVREIAQQTRGALVTYNGDVALTAYCSWSAGKTRSMSGYPYMTSITDQYGNYNDSYFSFDHTGTKTQDELINSGNHMYGLIAMGSYHAADTKKWSAIDILRYYYTNKVSLQNNY